MQHTGLDHEQRADTDPLKTWFYLTERLHFEELISSISARFINVPLERVDEEINQAMQQVLGFFQADRFALLETFPDKKTWIITHCVSVPDVPAVPVGTVLPRAINPWAYEKLVDRHEVLYFSKLDEVPEEARTDIKTWAEWGIKSNLNIPVMVGPVDHVIALNSIRTEHHWPEELIPRLRLLGEIFVNVIERSRAQKALQESEARLNLATSAAQAGLWALDVDSGRIWTSPIFREMLGIPGGADLDFERFMQFILPEDDGMVRYVVQDCIHERGDLKIEYRVRRPDGGIRWMLARGRYYPGAPGSPSQLMGVTVDETERREIDLQLKKSQTSLDTLINSTPDMIWSVDAKRFGLLSYNSALYDYFLNENGLQISPGMAPVDLFDSEERVQIWNSFYQQLLSNGSFTTEYTTYRGNRTLRLNFNALKFDGTVFGISVFAQNITDLKKMEEQLRDQLTEIEQLKCRVEKENIYLREEIRDELGFGRIIGSSDSLNYVLFRVRQVATTDATVLILGETGSGKGMIAHSIHEISLRKDKSMITVNCAALPANLIESELFGREKGAFTGAHARQAGRFEVADGGTIFLDEIGELPLELQAKLLRVLQDGEFERLGSPRTIKVNVRVIASTSRDLKEEMRNGRFREDLYYRLNTFPVTIPPLRKRIEDIPELAMHFLNKYSRKFGRHYEHISRDVMPRLQAYDWPGNVRELEHVIERAVITSPGPVFRLDQLEYEHAKPVDGTPRRFETIARDHILHVLQETSWKIEGEDGAAAILGLNPSTLRFRIKKLGISRPGKI